MYRCPKCGSSDELFVVVKAWARLTQDGDDDMQTDADADGCPDFSHDWDEDSVMACQADGCGFRGKAGSFEAFEGVEGQDRDNYSDDQDRENYTA